MPALPMPHRALQLVPSNDPILRQPCRPVEESELAELRDSKFLYWLNKFVKQQKGLAIAAPQLGDSRAWFYSAHAGIGLVVNPLITWQSGAVETRPEGCLSFPGQTALVTRPLEIHVSYLDEHGPRERRLHYLPARIFLHEYDHLQGKCIVP